MKLNFICENNDLRSNNEEENKVSGKQWLKYSISVWDDCKKTEEKAYSHPASFPVELVKKLIRLYSKSGDLILDPFVGVGSTLAAATEIGRRGIGFEINTEFIESIHRRLTDYSDKYRVINDSCISMGQYLSNESIDFCITSPPYWDILNRNRTADKKNTRNYSDRNDDLGNIEQYKDFLNELNKILINIFRSLKSNKHCVLIVMDIRKKNKFYPFHIYIKNLMTDICFKLEDFIIWDRRKEYNNLKPLGYPSVFRVNKVHEYICIFKKNEAKK